MINEKYDSRSSSKTSVVKSIDSLISWSIAEPSSGTSSESSSIPVNKEIQAGNPSIFNSRFPIDHTINSKLFLLLGDILELDVDAIVNPNGEWQQQRSVRGNTKENNASSSLFLKSGPEMLKSLQQQEPCKTGEARITKGFNLIARNVIHTIGPRYHETYKTAAESALHCSYRACLQTLKENGLRTIAFPPIYSEAKNYPCSQGVHIAVRTVRRFLEHWGEGIDAVIFVLEREQDYDLYRQVLPLYCPRNESEETAAIRLLPEDTGNEYGETVIEERKIRISTFPGMSGENSDDSESDGENHSTVGNISSTMIVPKVNYEIRKEEVIRSGLTQMERNPDFQRIPKLKEIQVASATIYSDADEEEKAVDHLSLSIERNYKYYLNLAQSTNLRYIDEMKLIYYAGNDSSGHPIVVAIGKKFSNFSSSEKELPLANNVDLLLMYIINLMDPIVQNQFSIVYLHSDMSSHKMPSFEWLRSLHDLFDIKYSKNIKNVYIVHPTLWLKLFFMFMSPFLNKVLKTRMNYLYSLQELFAIFPRAQLNLPNEIFIFDQLKNDVKWIPSSHESPHNEL